MPRRLLPCAVWAGEKGKGSVSAQELNRNSGGRLGCLQERVEAGWGFWWRAGGQPQVREHFADHRGIVNGGEDGQGAAALGTGGEVDDSSIIASARISPIRSRVSSMSRVSGCPLSMRVS